ncbi:hypothetical protein HYW76_01420 [Candidatus Pacearchaeota archaeon]|nr:hypothetical protein [Candidatus Pacearchaeota archaeon]
MVYYSFLSSIMERLNIKDINELLLNAIIAFFLLVIGVFAGRIAKSMLRRFVQKYEMKSSNMSFIKLVLTVIEWSIYVLFLSFALDHLNIPQLTGWLTSILIVFPAVVGALLLIFVGFAIAVYMRDLVEESGVLDAKVLSKIFYYFIIYVFLVFSAKAALISLDKEITNILIIILTAVVGVAVAYNNVISSKERHKKENLGIKNK